MRTIIAGSRDIVSWQTLLNALDDCGFPITEVVSGNARGVDALGEYYAKVKGLPLKLFPADWASFGKKAGFLRNMEMADYAEALVAIWDGKSKGTKMMIELANAKGLKVYVYHALV